MKKWADYTDFKSWAQPREAKLNSLLLRPLPKRRDEAESAQGYSLNVLLSIFLCISVIGWFFEIALYLVDSGVLVNPGFLHGPWIPIYGVCSVLIAVTFKDWNRSPLALFVLVAALCGMVELITGNFLELVTGAKWWDYSHFAFNLGGYVCLEALTLFGAFGLLLIYGIAPACKRILERIPLRIQLIVFGVFYSIFAFDVLYSCIYPNFEVYVDVLSFF